MTKIITTPVKLANNPALRTRSKAHAKEALSKFKYVGEKAKILRGIAEKGYYITDRKILTCSRHYAKTKSSARKRDYQLQQL